MAVAKKKADYNKLTVEKLAELYSSLSPEEQQKMNFNEYVEDKPAKTELVDVKGADGKPKYYIDKNGNTRIKKTRKPIGTKKKKVFNLMKAKRAFYDKYTDKFNWITKPVEKSNASKKENKTKAALETLGIKLD